MSCSGQPARSSRARVGRKSKHVDDALELGFGEVLFQAHRARIEDTAGGHYFDHVHASGGELADDLLAFIDAGADRRIEVRFVDGLRELRWKPGRLVGVAAND